MASEGSVAPKERVNIVYRPATGDAKAEVELPLKLLVMGDYTLREDETPIEAMKPISVDKDNFNDVLKGQKLSLDLSVPNKLDDKAEPDAVLAVNMKFDSINDFTPDAIVDKVPELRQMIALRDALKGPLGNIPELQNKIPTEVLISERRDFELAEQGFIALTMRKNSDNAAFFSANSAQKPKFFGNTKEGKDAELNYRLSTQLPYMSVAWRITSR